MLIFVKARLHRLHPLQLVRSHSIVSFEEVIVFYKWHFFVPNESKVQDFGATCVEWCLIIFFKIKSYIFGVNCPRLLTNLWYFYCQCKISSSCESFSRADYCSWHLGIFENLIARKQAFLWLHRAQKKEF